jgi:type IX secretion system PorP/SprF family membrane protein
MNKFKCLLVVTAFSMQAMAQQKPYYTQYILNNYILNPALSGIENYTDVKLSYRNQWSGINGAPVSMYASVQGSIGRNKPNERATATSFGKTGINEQPTAYFDDDTKQEPHHGLGMIIMNDKTGYLSRFSLYATYAYHKPLTPKLTLAAGFLVGFSNMSLDRSKIVWGDLDPSDIAVGINDGDLKSLKPEVGAGLWLYAKNYFLGLSALNIIPGKASFSSANKYASYYQPHFFASAGYRFWMTDDYSFLPSVSVQSISPQPLQVHINGKFQFQDKLWIGGSYRATDQLGGFAAMAGFNVSNVFNIGYAYDLSTNSRLRTYTKNTHEIIIGFLLNNTYGDSCPRNVW